MRFRLFGLLLLFIFFLPSAPARAADCFPFFAALTGSSREQVADLADLQCEARDRIEMPNLGIRVEVLTRDDVEVPDATIAAVREGFLAADEVVPSLGSRVSSSPIQLVLADSYETLGDLEDGQTFRMTGHCNMLIPRSGWRETATYLKFIVAHETFHCIQWGFAARQMAEGEVEGPEGDMIGFNRWWIEGSAEWFAHLAVAGGQTEHLEVYELRANFRPLTGFDYPAFPFFVWLGNKFGAQGAYNYLRGLPDELHTPEMIAATLTPDLWQEYAQAYSAYSIALPDGRRLVPGEKDDMTVLPIDTEGEYDVSVNVSRLSRTRLEIAPGKWRFEADEDTRAAFSEIADGVPDGAWRPLSKGAEVWVRCNSEGNYLLAAYGSSPGASQVHFRAVLEEEPCQSHCDMLAAPAEHCVIGTWETTETDEQLRFDIRKLDRAGVPYEPGSTSEGMATRQQLTFRPDGSWRLHTPPYTVKHNVPLPAGGPVAEMKIVNELTDYFGTWGLSRSKLEVCRTGIKDVYRQVTAVGGAVLSDRPTTDVRSYSPPDEWTIRISSCDARKLILDTSLTGVPGRIEFTRLAGESE